MDAARRSRLPAGRQPYDPLNGFRVGAFVGGLLGAVATVVIGIASAWLVFVGGALGGVIGYSSEKRKMKRGPTERM
ncbi:MAG: hypothetical protein OEU32_01440 [Acidimicrobiia bacterium]|nr:hypothetical protein [Acidimicrobiia bacterium]